MSNLLIAFLVAMGATVWLYTKFAKRTGGNGQRSVIGALIVGLLVFLIMLFILATIREK